MLVPLLRTCTRSFSWSMVASHIEGRCGRECKQRWKELKEAPHAVSRQEWGAPEHEEAGTGPSSFDGPPAPSSAASSSAAASTAVPFAKQRKRKQEGSTVGADDDGVAWRRQSGRSSKGVGGVGVAFGSETALAGYPAYSVGQRVESFFYHASVQRKDVSCSRGAWYVGTVDAVHADGSSVAVLYDDGERVERVPVRQVRPHEAHQETGDM